MNFDIKEVLHLIRGERNTHSRGCSTQPTAVKERCAVRHMQLMISTATHTEMALELNDMMIWYTTALSHASQVAPQSL